MRKFLAALALVGVLALAASAKAMMIAPSPISQRVARSDAVVVGKVTSLAEKTEKAEMFKGDERQMRVATLAVEEAVQGKKTRTVQVGFFPPPPPPAPGGGIRIIRGGGNRSVQLTKDHEGMLFLTKHPTKKDLYVVQQYFEVVPKAGNPSFAAQRDEARKYAKLLKEAKTGLDSKDAAVRFETAMMLVTRYRSAPTGVTKTEAVPADESKKILAALAGADWKKPTLLFGQVSPLSTFFLLSLQPKDGWTAPKDGTQFPAEAKKWLEANAGKYTMTRFVREADKKDGTEPE
jgi:hypothetical protein